MTTLCAVKSIASGRRHGGDSIVTTCKVEDQVVRRTNWNTWIVICSLIVVVAAVLFIEHHIRGLLVHSGVLR